jgi:hypothetical protein
MSRAISRRYRVRFAERGATDITTSTVDFILEVPDITEVPVVAGSFVHPLDGATEMRPLHVRGVDKAGGLIELFAEGRRWTAIGRVVDIQYQLSADDPDTDPWTTYGTGRCSGLDELDGPGLFRIEISDETWVVRNAELWVEADTTQLWPLGLRFPWRGFAATVPGSGSNAGSVATDVYRINVTGPGSPGFQPYDRGVVTDELIRFIERDLIPYALRTTTAPNYETLRLNFDGTDYEVVTVLNMVAGNNTFSVDVYSPGGSPSGSGNAFLYAPTHEPTDDAPFHVGVQDDSHPWGYPFESTGIGLGSGGYLHPADLTRRVWIELGARYNASNLDLLETDTTFPLLAPYVLEPPDDPQKWMQENVWGPALLLALRDADGRMKLADLRPPPANIDLSPFTLLDHTNSDLHRWRLVSSEAINAVRWEWATFTDEGDPDLISPPPFFNLPRFGGVLYGRAGENTEGPRLDFLARRHDHLGPLEDPYLNYIGRRERALNAYSPLEPLDAIWPGNVARNLTVLWTGRGWLLDDVAVQAITGFILDTYQDGPMRGRCEVGGSTAETIEEGQYIVVDCTEVKIANPFTAARFGKVLALTLSVTRYPAHAEVEYLIIREALYFLCPDPLDPSTWLLSPFNQATTVRVSLIAPEPESGDPFAFKIRARKNATGGDQIDMTVALVSNSVAVATWVETNVSATWTDYVFTLDASEQALIYDWTALFLDITRNGTIDSDPSNWRRLEISEIEAV